MPRSRSRYIPAADRFLRSTGNIADKGFNAFARQNRGVADHCQASYDLWGSLQDLNLSCAKVHLHSRSIKRNTKIYEHYKVHGEYPSLFVRGWWWVRDVVILYPLAVLWAYVQPILLYLFFMLAQVVLLIVFSIIIYGGIFLLLTA